VVVPRFGWQCTSGRGDILVIKILLLCKDIIGIHLLFHSSIALQEEREQKVSNMGYLLHPIYLNGKVVFKQEGDRKGPTHPFIRPRLYNERPTLHRSLCKGGG
jgi:hypothetical protein